MAGKAPRELEAPGELEKKVRPAAGRGFNEFQQGTYPSGGNPSSIQVRPPSVVLKKELS